jgi:hypothetical protein
MSHGKKPGLLHFLQRLFRLGADPQKPAQPAPPPKKKRPSHAPKRKPPGKGSAKKEPPSDKPAKKEPHSRDKPAKKVATKPKSGVKPKAPTPAPLAEAPGEVPPHERPPGDRQKESPEENTAPSVYTPVTPEKPERKTEPSAKPAPAPAGPAATPGKELGGKLGTSNSDSHSSLGLLDSGYVSPDLKTHMTSPVPQLRVEVVHGEIIVTLPGFRYSVTYYKPDRSPQLMARNIPTKDDPAAAITGSEFLQAAWWLANNKARDLGWIV